MRIVTAGRVKEWCESHSMIKAQLLRWLGMMEDLEDCTSFDDLRKSDNTVDQVKVASERLVCVFELGYKKSAHRLIAAVHFNTQIVYVLRLYTHAEYDKDEWKKEL